MVYSLEFVFVNIWHIAQRRSCQAPTEAPAAAAMRLVCMGGLCQRVDKMVEYLGHHVESLKHFS